MTEPVSLALFYFDGTNWCRLERDNLAGIDPSTLAVLPFGEGATDFLLGRIAELEAEIKAYRG